MYTPAKSFPFSRANSCLSGDISSPRDLWVIISLNKKIMSLMWWLYQRAYIKKPETNHVDICHPPMCTSHPVGKKLTFISCTHNFPCHILLRRQNTRNTHKYPRANKEPGNIWSNISTSTRPEPAHYQNMFSIPDPNPPDISKTPLVVLCTLVWEQTLFWPT